MKLSFFVEPEAEGELGEAFHWYEDKSRGLGEKFLTAIDGIFTTLRSAPQQFPQVYNDVRRAVTRRFPYAVFFVVENDVVMVLAILHQARDPQRWKNRI